VTRPAASLVIACAAALAGAAAWAAPPVPLAKNQSIATARAKLKQAGWRPLKMKYQGTDTAFMDFWYAGYTETEQCAADDSFCVLDYTDGHGNCLRVMFDYGALKPLKAWVSSWTRECPNPAMIVKPTH
jgi:hypothetical protein